jgi:hypothetical protein
LNPLRIRVILRQGRIFMTQQQALNATFFAFRKREKGGVLLGATLAFIAGAVLLTAVFLALTWASVVEVVRWYGQIISAAGDPQALANIGFPAGLLAFFPLFFLWLFFFFVLYAAYEAACLRWLVRGETGGLLGLTLGGDTWRVYSTYWVWFGLYLAGSTALSLAMVAILGVALGGMATDSNQMGVSAGLSVALLYILYYGAMIYFAVRFAPAAATSIARRRFAFFESWRVTKGRFWPLLGSFLLIWLINVVTTIVLGSVALTLLFAGAFANVDMTKASSDPQAFLTTYMSAMGQVFSNPVTLAGLAIYYVAATFVGMVFVLLFFGVNARAALAAQEDGKLLPAAS